MTATRTWSQLEGGVLHTGTTTSTFTGVWQPDGPDATTVFPCSQSFQAPPCVVYRPTGTIDWTWDSEWPADDFQPGCQNHSTGSLAAGVTTHPDTQSLVLQPTETGQFQYRGLGAFVIEEQDCPDPINSGSNPPAFFDILENARNDAPPDDSGDTCFHTTWLIESNAASIAGSCVSFMYSYHSLRFSWNLRSVPPG